MWVRLACAAAGKFWTVPEGSMVRFIRVPKKVLEKVPGGFVPDQVRVNRARSSVPEKVWEALVKLRCFQRLALQHASKRFEKIERCSCWGYHQSLFVWFTRL